MSDAAPQARDISPRPQRIAGGAGGGPGPRARARRPAVRCRRPVTDVQTSLQAERIATSPATPYRNFPVEYMPLETAADRTVAGRRGVGDGRSDRAARLRRRPRRGVRARVGLGAARRDRVPVARAPAPVVHLPAVRPASRSRWRPGRSPATKRRGEDLGGAALGLAVMAKLWPLALAPVLVIRRAWRPAVAGFAVVVVVLGAAWYLTGGPKGPFQVLTFAVPRVARREHRRRSVLWIAGRGIPVVEADALRVGFAAPWVKGLLVPGVGRLRGRDLAPRRRNGSGSVRRRGARGRGRAHRVLAADSRCSTPPGSCRGRPSRSRGTTVSERTATIAAVAVALTGLIALAWPDQIVAPSAWMKLLVLCRNAAAVVRVGQLVRQPRGRARLRQAAGAPVVRLRLGPSVPDAAFSAATLRASTSSASTSRPRAPSPRPRLAG